MTVRAKTESTIERSKEFLRVYSMLIRAAQQQGFVTEDDVAELMGIADCEGSVSRSTAKMLEVIASRENMSGRPILSAVVLTSATHRPVRAFQKSASDLGKLPPKVTKDQRDTFWKSELKRVYEEWRD
jgi:hypothetical protein